MAPRAVLMKTGLKSVNTARPVNTVRSVNTGRPFSTTRSFNTVRPFLETSSHPKSTVHCARQGHIFQNQAQINCFNKQALLPTRETTLQKCVINQGLILSNSIAKLIKALLIVNAQGRHMTENIAHPCPFQISKTLLEVMCFLEEEHMVARINWQRVEAMQEELPNFQTAKKRLGFMLTYLKVIEQLVQKWVIYRNKKIKRGNVNQGNKSRLVAQWNTQRRGITLTMKSLLLILQRPDDMFAVCACAKVSSDYAGATQDRKSTTGGCQFLGNRLISWQCKKQTVVATSTTEAEYVAATNCCRQVLWIQNQLLDYGYNFMNTVIYIDNTSTICIIENPVQHFKIKHIEIRHHFIRDCNAKKLIQMAKIDTEHNVADLLTKGFDAGRFQYLVSTLASPEQTATAMASPKQTAIGKDLSNPFMAGSLPKTTLCVNLSAEASTDDNREVQITATIDGHSMSISEASLSRHLKLDDQDGITSIPNSVQEARVLNNTRKTKEKLGLFIHDDEDNEDDFYQRRQKSEEKRTRKDKGKAIMTESEPKKKSKKELEQERLSFAEAIRLEEQMNEEQRAHIARDEEIARQ
ncbi:hypothetical protein Tco_1292945 [Tanacetum coccineum]